MAIPFAVVGYGNNSTARNVFSATFSTALSAPVQYEMVDGASPPAVGALTTTANTIFAGTAGNSNKPMMSLVDTTNAAPSSAWKPANATAGEANPNRMKGQTNYVQQDGANVGAGGRITWNMVCEIPSDLNPATATMDYDLILRYSYSGSAPTVAWFGNEGTEGTPTWTQMTPGTHMVRHTNAAASAGGPYHANVPGAGTEDTAEGWITT